MGAEERPPERVDVVPLGAFPEATALDLLARVSRRLPVPFRLRRLPAPLATPRIEGRADQVDADRLLEALERAAEPDRSTLLLGLTALDLGNPIFTFFFGRARLGGRAGIVSVARLDPAYYGLPADRETTARRAVVEMLHELGHVAGIPHCDDHACVMRVTHTVEALDARGGSYCERCRARLPASWRPG